LVPFFPFLLPYPYGTLSTIIKSSCCSYI
jgi:hypothetical protein